MPEGVRVRWVLEPERAYLNPEPVLAPEISEVPQRWAKLQLLEHLLMGIGDGRMRASSAMAGVSSQLVSRPSKRTSRHFPQLPSSAATP